MRASRVFGFWCASGARFVHEAARVVRERRRVMRRGVARVIEFRSTKSAAVQFLAALATCDACEQQKATAFEQAGMRSAASRGWLFCRRCNMRGFAERSNVTRKN